MTGHTATGTIIIFYMGSSDQPSPFPSGGSQAEFNQRIGVAWSRDGPYGPWHRSAQPVLEPSPRGQSWDDGFVSNPVRACIRCIAALLCLPVPAMARCGS